jgi:hypothetical protein
MPLSVIVTCIAGESEATIDLGRRDSCDPRLVLVISPRRAVAPVDNAWRVAAHVSIGAVAGASVGAVRRSLLRSSPRPSIGARSNPYAA